jgi:hypothetical protein
VPTSPQAGLLLLFVNLCGFVINSATIPGGWIAVYWANPVTYMFTSLAVNEFTSPDWATPVDGTPIGEIVLQTRCVAGRGRRRALLRPLKLGVACLRRPAALHSSPSDALWPPLLVLCLPRPCSGYQQKYLYVWLAIFVWGAAASVLNFVACVFFLATLPGEPAAVRCSPSYPGRLLHC